MPDVELNWHIPMDDARRTWRLRWLRILIAALLYLATLWLFASRDMRLPGLAALVPMIAILLFFSWKASRRSGRDDDNMRLSKVGLSWKHPHGGTGEFRCENIRGFRIGLDPDTLRAVPALTLLLTGGFESQPIELYEPASPDRVRRYLSDTLGLAERPASDEQFARQLRFTLETALDGEPDSPARRLLRQALVRPSKSAAGTWRVASLPDGCDVFHDPLRSVYQVVSLARDEMEASSVAELLTHIRRYALPRDESAAQALVAKLHHEKHAAEHQAFVDDVRAAGIYFEPDEQGRWHFEGSRERLMALCDSVEQAARQLQPAPLGARPSTRKLGGDVMRLKLQVGDRAWTDDETICGPREQLVELAAKMRESLTLAKVDSHQHVAAKAGSRQPLVVVLHVKRDGHDPAAQFENPA